VDRRLERAAQRHSDDMGERDYFAHDGPDGRRPEDRVRAEGVPRRGVVVAENLAWGADVEARPKAIVDGWMESPGHRANIVRAELTHVGVGIGLDAPEPAIRERSAVYTTDFTGRP
jgi:uncharacterized protein YkwD